MHPRDIHKLHIAQPYDSFNFLNQGLSLSYCASKHFMFLKMSFSLQKMIDHLILKGCCWGYLLPTLVFCVFFNIPKFFELESPYNSHHHGYACKKTYLAINLEYMHKEQLAGSSILNFDQHRIHSFRRFLTRYLAEPYRQVAHFHSLRKFANSTRFRIYRSCPTVLKM